MAPLPRPAFFIQPYIYFAYFDYTVVAVALIANCFVLTAIVRFSAFSKHTFFQYFLISLIASDLFVTIVNVGTLAFQLTNDFWPNEFDDKVDRNVSEAGIDLTKSPHFKCIANLLKALRLTGFFANLLTLCGISLNHFFGVVYPDKYRVFLKKNVACFAVFAVWFLSFFLALVDIPVNVIMYHYEGSKFANISNEGLSSAKKGALLFEDYADSSPDSQLDWAAVGPKPHVMYENEQDEEDEEIQSTSETVNKSGVADALNRMLSIIQDEDMAHRSLNQDSCTFFTDAKMWFEICVIGLAFASAIALTLSYGIIIRKISKNGQLLGQSTRKSIFTTVLLIVAFLICWLPFMVFEFVMLLLFHNDETRTASNDSNLLSNSYLVQCFVSSILMLYPLMDAVIYSMRIPAVKGLFFNILAVVCPCISEIFKTMAQRQLKTLSSEKDMTNQNETSVGLLEIAQPGAGNSETSHSQLTGPKACFVNTYNSTNVVAGTSGPVKSVAVSHL